MNDRLYSLADKIVAYFKEREGNEVTMHSLKTHLQDAEKGHTLDNIKYVTEILVDKEILNKSDSKTIAGSYDGERYWLSAKGWEYKGFEQFLQDEKTSKDLKAKKDAVDLKNAERVYKSYPLTRCLAWVGAITGIVTLLLKLAEILGILPKSK